MIDHRYLAEESVSVEMAEDEKGGGGGGGGEDVTFETLERDFQEVGLCSCAKVHVACRRDDPV